MPDRLAALLRVLRPAERQSFTAHGRQLTVVGGVPGAKEFVAAAQIQTSESFGFKWAKRDTFEGEVAANVRRWLIEKYGDVPAAKWLFEAGPNEVRGWCAKIGLAIERQRVEETGSTMVAKRS